MNKEFDIEIAIKDLGICAEQKVACSDCLFGKTLYKLKGKDRLDDLCPSAMVFFISSFIKEFEKLSKKS